MAPKSSWLLGGHKVSELLPAGFSGSRKLVMALKISNADHQCLIHRYEPLGNETKWRICREMKADESQGLLITNR